MPPGTVARQDTSHPLVTPVLDCLRHVSRRNAGRPIQVCDGTRNLENAVVSTCGQSQAADGLAGKLLSIGICITVLADLLDRKVGIGFTLARDLESASRRDPLANDRARLGT